MKSLNDKIFVDISKGINSKNIYSGTQKCINGKFIPKESLRINTCDNCIWARETYPGSGIFICNKI